LFMIHDARQGFGLRRLRPGRKDELCSLGTLTIIGSFNNETIREILKNPKSEDQCFLSVQ
jgi:hypothetical protein